MHFEKGKQGGGKVKKKIQKEELALIWIENSKRLRRKKVWGISCVLFIKTATFNGEWRKGVIRYKFPFTSDAKGVKSKKKKNEGGRLGMKTHTNKKGK